MWPCCPGTQRSACPCLPVLGLKDGFVLSQDSPDSLTGVEIAGRSKHDWLDFKHLMISINYSVLNAVGSDTSVLVTD